MFPLLIFCLVDLSIVVSGVLKSPNTIVLLLISSFILVSVRRTHCGAPILGAYIFIIVILLLGLILWSLCSVLLCLFSQPLFDSLFYLIWVLRLLLSFGLRLHEIFFSSPSLFFYFKYTVGTFILTLLKDISPCLMIWYKNQTHHTFPISLSTSRAIRNLYNMNICFWNKNYKLSDNKNTQINWTLNKALHFLSVCVSCFEVGLL